jgi:hypothetical protein
MDSDIHRITQSKPLTPYSSDAIQVLSQSQLLFYSSILYFSTVAYIYRSLHNDRALRILAGSIIVAITGLTFDDSLRSATAGFPKR